MEVLDFKNILWEFTRKISDNTNILITSLCEEYDLTTLQIRILVEVKKTESHTIGSLASRLNIASTNISTMCKKLEMKGFLERVRNQADERVVSVILSKMGNKVVDEIDQELMKRISESLERETDETLIDIIEGIKKLNKLLENIVSKKGD